jgi:hypothetical protein
MQLQLGPSRTPSLKSSLIAINKVANELADVLQRTPSQVGGYTMGLAQQVEDQTDFLLVDRVLILVARMNKHLDNIASALETNDLYDSYNATHGQVMTLVEALERKWQAINTKRSQDLFLENNFGRELDRITNKIQLIQQKIPIYSAKYVTVN